jgi:hypothetical protein
MVGGWSLRKPPDGGCGATVPLVHRSSLRLLLSTLLLVAAVGCSDVRDRVDDLRAGAEDLNDRTQFCLSVARTATAIETGSPDTATAAAEEAVAQAPDELRDDARFVADRLRAARDGDKEALRDPEVRDAAERLRDRTREMCDPTS